MTVLARREDGLEVDDDPARVDLDVTYDLVVNQAYWATERTRDFVAQTIAASWSFGVYDGDRQLGFARVVTDRLTFAWVCDVVVDEPLRGRGIGHFLMQTVTEAVSSTIVGWQVLRTRDAHSLYRDLGWTDLVEADRWMEIRP